MSGYVDDLLMFVTDDATTRMRDWLNTDEDNEVELKTVVQHYEPDFSLSITMRDY